MSELNLWLIGGGAAVGALFAVAVQRFRFCLIAAVGNFVLIRDTRQVMTLASALLVAIGGTQLLEIFEVVDIAQASYRDATLDWLGAALGGLIFGVGATLAGGCAARTLVSTMEGSVHALIVLLTFALVAALVQFGFLEPYRVALTGATAITLQGDAGVATLLALSPWWVLLAVMAALSGFILYCWRRSPNPGLLLVGVMVGLLVVASWYLTGVVAQDEFMPTRPSAMTMSGPLSRAGYFLISGQLAEPSFAIAFAVSMAVASLLLAVATRQFRITLPAKGMVKIAVAGGALMGLGAIMAYGCNVGQGMSGLSTLSLESMIAVVGIVSGIAATTRWMEHRG
ncbi:MAG: YeeE/YedE family protein [Chromatiales bacterium]|nr:YeeE/YedE family protein [Chromatiales bacterium]